MSERNIHEALRSLHDTISLMSNSCCRHGLMEETSSIENLEKVQKEMTNMKGNHFYFLYDRGHLLEILDMYHSDSFEHEEYISNLTDDLDTTHDYLKST